MTNQRKIVRQIIPYKNYFKDFKKNLKREVLLKIYYVFTFIMTNEIVPIQFFKSIEGVKNLYEIRIEAESNIYRVFCCLDEGNLVILFNAFQKKTTKTPLKEIEKAKHIMTEYFAAKKRIKEKN